MIELFVIELFGTIIFWLSALKKTVLNIVISVIVPLTPPATTLSPALKGLNKTIITPEAKFPKESFKAKPIAKPAAPKIAKNEVVSTPSLFKAAIITTVNKE